VLPSAGCVVPLLFVFEDALRPKVRSADITLDSRCLAFLSCCHVNSMCDKMLRSGDGMAASEVNCPTYSLSLKLKHRESKNKERKGKEKTQRDKQIMHETYKRIGVQNKAQTK
jgi:hypothetical protein